MAAKPIPAKTEIVAPAWAAPKDENIKLEDVTAGDETERTSNDTEGNDPVVDSVDKTTVTVVVPKAYVLRLDDNSELRIPAGVQEMNPAHAAHWYSKANGVSVYKPNK
jgi:hypothetical protein